MKTYRHKKVLCLIVSLISLAGNHDREQQQQPASSCVCRGLMHQYRYVCIIGQVSKCG